MLPALEAYIPDYFNFGCTPRNTGNLEGWSRYLHNLEGKSTHDVWVEKNAISKDT